MPIVTLRRFAAVSVFVLACAAGFAQNTIHVPADQPTIQAGINAAASGDTVLVAPGTYHEHIDFLGKAITLTSSGGATQTIIDGDAQGGIATVAFTHNEKNSSVLANLTIRGGGDELLINQSFGGVFASDASPLIRDNIITANYCDNIAVSIGVATITGNEISGVLQSTQSSSYCDFGAGVFLGGTNGSGPGSVVTGNTIESNHGPGVSIWAAQNVLLNNNIIRNNTSNSPGAAFTSANSVGTAIIQNLIYGNSTSCGGAIGFQVGGVGPGPQVLIANNTIVDNTDSGGGGSSNCTDIAQIYPSPYSYGNSGPSVAIVNNIISGSTIYPAVNCNFYSSPSEAGQPVFDHNILYNAGGAFFGSLCVNVSAKYGNIVADPQMVNPASGDFHLKPTSPAIDAGNTSVLQSIQSLSGTSLTKDFDNNPRIQDTTGKGYPIIDIGAYEYSGLLDASATTVVLTASEYIGNAGSNYTLTATFASPIGIPTGGAAFFLDGKLLGTSLINGAGVATLTNFLLTPGVHNLYVSYDGQGSFTPATSVIIIVDISSYTTALSLSGNPSPSLVGQPVTFTIASSSADPSYIPSPITLTDGSTTLATLTPNSSGIATYTTSTLALGSHYITASYAGDATHSSTSTSFSQQVTSGYATSITLTSLLNPSISGQNVTFSATVTGTTGTPTGSVQFTDGLTVLGTQPLNSAGVATFSISTLSVGLHTIYGYYVPTGSFAGTSTSIGQTVSDNTSAITLTSSLNPSTYGQPVTITAHVAPANGVPAIGSVTFSEGSQILSVQPVDASGNAAVTLSTLSVGGHLITGAFTPNGSPHTFAGMLTQQVDGIATSTLLTATPLTGIAHITPITLTAVVAPATSGGATPGGQVLFYVNGAQFHLSTMVNGVATYTGTLPAGVNQIYAAYVGDPNSMYDSSNSNTLTVTITAAPTTLSLVSGFNPAPAFTPFPVTAALGITGSSQAAAADPITLTITPITPGASPPATFPLVTNSLGTVIYNVPGLLPGQYTVTATFAGTTDLQPSSSIPFIETITANPTATTLTASPSPGIQNNPVTFTSTVSALAGVASPAGTVTIYDSLSPSTAFTPIATLTLPAGTGAPTTATFTTSALAPGTHILYAAFTPAAGFAPSQSAQYTLVIEPQSFTLTLSEPNLSLQTGHHHTETATLTSIGGLTGTFTLSCGTLPQYASCTWSQGPITLPANGTVSTSLTVDTDQLLDFVAANTHPASNPDAPFMARSMRHEWAATAAFTLLPLTLLGFKRRRKLSSLLPLLILAALATTLTACGASQYPYSTTPGTYVLSVTATAPPTPGGSSPTKTANLTLVVTR